MSVPDPNFWPMNKATFVKRKAASSRVEIHAWLYTDTTTNHECWRWNVYFCPDATHPWKDERKWSDDFLSCFNGWAQKFDRPRGEIHFGSDYAHEWDDADSLNVSPAERIPARVLADANKMVRLLEELDAERQQKTETNNSEETAPVNQNE